MRSDYAFLATSLTIATVGFGLYYLGPVCGRWHERLSKDLERMKQGHAKDPKGQIGSEHAERRQLAEIVKGASTGSDQAASVAFDSRVEHSSPASDQGHQPYGD